MLPRGTRSTRARRGRALLGPLVLGSVFTLGSVGGSPARGEGATGIALATADAPATAIGSASPDYRWRTDGVLVGAGLAVVLVASSLETESVAVPSDGLSPTRVRLGFDRGSIGEKSADADQASNRLRTVALSFPVALRLATTRDQGLVEGPLGASLLYVESMAIAEGLTGILKQVASRPRPYTYLSDTDRPSSSGYDVRSASAFQSFPSGHATAAWCAISVGICDHLLSRPTADWKEHALVGFVGGTLGAATSSLRVEAGQHFPSDVFAGAAIGAMSGSAVPFLHRYSHRHGAAPLPGQRSVLATLGGTALGVGAGLVVAEIIGD